MKLGDFTSISRESGSVRQGDTLGNPSACTMRAGIRTRYMSALLIHLAQACGMKAMFPGLEAGKQFDSSCASVWDESVADYVRALAVLIHLAQACGMKVAGPDRVQGDRPIHLAQACGMRTIFRSSRISGRSPVTPSVTLRVPAPSEREPLGGRRRIFKPPSQRVPFGGDDTGF